MQRNTASDLASRAKLDLPMTRAKGGMEYLFSRIPVAPRRCYSRSATGLLSDLGAFVDERRWCGDLDAGVENGEPSYL